LERLPIKVANPPSIRDPLALARSLRPLMRQVPSGQIEGLDEQATAQQIAEAGIWQPIVKPALEPWLELVLVADESPSMLIWRQTVLEFRKLLRNYGAFRDVQLWGLYGESDLPQPPTIKDAPDIPPLLRGARGVKEKNRLCLRPGIGSEALNSAPRQPEEILDPSGRRLIVLITDCVAAYWQDQALMKTLKLWSQHSPVAIAQVLPEWLWVRTAIRGFESVQLTALEPGMPNSHLVIDWSSVWAGQSNGKAGVCVPIVPLEPDSVLTWSQMVMGQSEAPGYWLQAFPTDAEESQPASLSPKQRVERFQVMSSPVAQRLMGLVAASPVITLPVIRLIQETLLPKSRQMNVAEVLLGGLLEPINPPQLGANPDEVEYRFVDEAIRDLLLTETPVTDTVRVLSEFIERQFDKSLDEFVAELLIWSQSEDSALVDTTRPFATVTASVLKRKGGKYREFVQQIERQYSRVFEQHSSGDTLTAHDYLSQRLAEIEDRIVEQFLEEDLQFEMNLRPDEEAAEGIDQITLADTQEITANIVNPVKLVEADESCAWFELFAEIHFAVEISYFDHDAYISEIHEDNYPTTSTTFLNQLVSAQVSVAVLLPDDDSSEFGIDSVDLTVPQPIRVYYEGAPNHQDIPTKTAFPALQTFEFQTARIAFEEEEALQPFEFEMATVEVQQKGLFRRQSQVVIKREPRQAWGYVERLSETVELEMVAIPEGQFRMGSPKNEPERYQWESPQHKVSVPAFFMGKYPVTQAQWRVVAGLPQVARELDSDPLGFEGENHPVEKVSWHDATEFCARLSQLTGKLYRLPSDAQWEYACRAGTTTPFHFGETITPDLANYDWNRTYGSVKVTKEKDFRGTTAVGSFGVANAFGVYDMHGNVWEWCEDHWHDNYEGAPNDGSAWIDSEAEEDAQRVLRGGSWYSAPFVCRSAARYVLNARFRDVNHVGFRVVCGAPRT
jgi:formylglycine-generating enzyme required for sulfatase activity